MCKRERERESKRERERVIVRVCVVERERERERRVMQKCAKMLVLLSGSFAGKQPNSLGKF